MTSKAIAATHRREAATASGAAPWRANRAKMAAAPTASCAPPSKKYRPRRGCGFVVIQRGGKIGDRVLAPVAHSPELSDEELPLAAWPGAQNSEGILASGFPPQNDAADSRSPRTPDGRSRRRPRRTSRRTVRRPSNRHRGVLPLRLRVSANRSGRRRTGLIASDRIGRRPPRRWAPSRVAGWPLPNRHIRRRRPLVRKN